MPLVFVQIVNVVTNTTTHDRFAFQNGIRTSSRGSKIEGSSSLLNEEEQLYSIMSGSKITSSLIQEVITKCCCFHTRISSSMRVSGCEEMRRQTIRESAN